MLVRSATLLSQRHFQPCGEIEFFNSQAITQVSQRKNIFTLVEECARLISSVIQFRTRELPTAAELTDGRSDGTLASYSHTFTWVGQSGISPPGTL